MSDAEKLQEIKDSFEWGKENLEEGLFNLVDEQIEWLIKQTEKLQKIEKRWIEIETSGTKEEADIFYSDVQDILSE